MKLLIMVLTVLLAAAAFTLEASKAHATTIEIHSIIFEDYEGNTYQKSYMAAGADLTNFDLPQGPERAGYQFVGWSAELPETMPSATLIFEPVYVRNLQLNFQFN
jgi:hypothetical protein